LGGDVGSLPSGDLLLLRALAGTGGDVAAVLGPRKHGGNVVEWNKEEEAERRRCSRKKKDRAMANENGVCNAEGGKWP
jgi:hypothetical protein